MKIIEWWAVKFLTGKIQVQPFLSEEIVESATRSPMVQLIMPKFEATSKTAAIKQAKKYFK